MPHQVEVSREHLNVNYTMFEATRIAPVWVEASRKHDLVILPTESSRRAWIDSGVSEERIRLCPLGINPAAFSGHQEAMHLQVEGGNAVSDYGVRFLNVSELGPRKNLLGLLQAWLSATSWQDDAVLVIKLGSYAPGWLPLFQKQLASLQTHLGKRLEEAAPVHFIYDLFSDSEMPGLYAAATHYISMSFGEGWDQAMVEAGASGLRLIAPDHSAYKTYLDGSVAQLIRAREVDAVFPGPTGALFQGAQWWEPDHDAACAAIRAAIDRRDREHGTARDRILSEFTWELATSRLLAIVGELEADKRSRRLWRSYRPSARGV
jgi:glycosyltransferase involved in cell wall biosynthesis